MTEKRIAFLFVEAGYGHIMPMQAALEAMPNDIQELDIEERYFFHQTDALKNVEKSFIHAVKQHNKIKGVGTLQYTLLKFFPQKLALDFLFKRKYKKAYNDAIQQLIDLDADVIFHSHFSTLYYACEAKAKGLIKSKNIVYVPDPIVGLQWDRRADLFIVSDPLESKLHKSLPLKKIPFLLRKEVYQYTFSKVTYRDKLMIPKDKFTITLVDGAYGAGKLKKTIYALLDSDKPMTIIAVCGKNNTLYDELNDIKTKDNITLKVFGFTDKILLLNAASDLFIGKAGASTLQEAKALNVPAIINYCASPLEHWIKDLHVTNGNAIYIPYVSSIVTEVESYIDGNEKYLEMKKHCHMGSKNPHQELKQLILTHE
ncbi:MAG: glycosyltransferase [Candidatus Izemoplasma sp.]|nr:glycosyltransferase [Candidatus Izemoplasma sp.]